MSGSEVLNIPEVLWIYPELMVKFYPTYITHHCNYQIMKFEEEIFQEFYCLNTPYETSPQNCGCATHSCDWFCTSWNVDSLPFQKITVSRYMVLDVLEERPEPLTNRSWHVTLISWVLPRKILRQRVGISWLLWPHESFQFPHKKGFKAAVLRGPRWKLVTWSMQRIINNIIMS